MGELAIQAAGVGKQYVLGELVGRQGLGEAVAGRLRRLGRRHEPPETIWSLRDVSFEVSEGDALGIIGRNGAGKSTLLKILSRITEPTTGVVRTRGRVGALLEVGTGFHPELSGRENVYLNGAVLGMGRRDIERRFDEIVAFAGVSRFLDTPVKRYSSGMYLRLAFAVAAHLEPDVLIVDEVLAVGDAEFQRRCVGKMAEVEQSGRTVVFVSHDMGAVARLCPRSIWLDAGRIVAEGPTAEVVRAYLGSVAGAHEGLTEGGLRAGPLVVHDVRVLGADGRPADQLLRGDPFTVELRFDLLEGVPSFDASVLVSTARGARVLDESWCDVEDDRGHPGRYVVQVEVPGVLNVGDHTVGAWFGTPYETFIEVPDLRRLVIDGGDLDRPDRVVCLQLPWRVEHAELEP